MRNCDDDIRWLAMTLVDPSLLVMLIHVRVIKLPSFLKKSALMANVILAYLLWDERFSSYVRKNYEFKLSIGLVALNFLWVCKRCSSSSK